MAKGQGPRDCRRKQSWFSRELERKVGTDTKSRLGDRLNSGDDSKGPWIGQGTYEGGTLKKKRQGVHISSHWHDAWNTLRQTRDIPEFIDTWWEMGERKSRVCCSLFFSFSTGTRPGTSFLHRLITAYVRVRQSQFYYIYQRALILIISLLPKLYSDFGRTSDREM